jgi:diguanylate cyclase (GGDEF)-like protein
MRRLRRLSPPVARRLEAHCQLLALSVDARGAAITLVDDARVRVASSHGLDLPDHARSSAFCAFTILEETALRVPDARRDPRFRDAPLVRERGLRAYAGVPIRGPQGLPVGAVAVFDDAPRPLGEREIRLLEGFAELVTTELGREGVRTAEVPAEPCDLCSLTRLPKKPAGMNQLEAMLERAAASDAGVALVIADIVDFHAINSAFGRGEGDAILRRAAALIAATSPAEALVFRIGGDQFAVAFPFEGPPADAVDSVVGALSASFSAPMRSGATEVALQLALGTAVFPDRAATAGELLDRAFLALRRGQERRTLAEVFTSELEERLVRDVTVEQGLRSALAREELSVGYQPKIDLRTGAIRSFEALCRWRDPDLGSVSPAEFIPAAERTGLIVELGQQVLRAAARDVLRLRERVPDLSVSVNVAAAQLQEEHFVERVLDVLDRLGCPPEALELEVVESVVIEQLDRAAAAIARLRERGVHFSLDDFGTGYSSLAYLHRLPVETIKIDRSFVSNMRRSERDAALVQSIVSMARVLGYAVVAEGVETREEALALCEFGCDFGQGYLWSPAVPLERALDLLGQ